MKSKLPRWVTSPALLQSGLDRNAVLRLRRTYPRIDINTLTRAEIEAWMRDDYKATVEMLSMRKLYLEKSGEMF